MGNTIVLEKTNAPLLEGSRVMVYLDEQGRDLDEIAWKEIDESIAEADRGEVVSMESVLAELRAGK